MVGLVIRKWSKSALWCRRLAVFAMPYFIIVILMHRFDKITSNQVMGLLAFGFIILIISVLLAMRAITQLWNHGAKGGKSMVAGLFLSLAMLTPFMIYAGFAIQYPALNDVSTNVNAPPAFSAKTIDLRNAQGVSAINNIEEGYSEAEITSILVSYPKISPRRFPAGPERVFKAVSEIVKSRGWRVTDIRGLPEEEEKPEVEEKTDKKSKKKSKKKAANAKNPEEDNGLEAAKNYNISLDAVTTSLIFSFKNDIVVTIVSEEQNTLVEMRSAARWGVHDFGQNSKLIEKFMHDLGQNLIGIAGEG